MLDFLKDASEEVKYPLRNIFAVADFCEADKPAEVEVYFKEQRVDKLVVQLFEWRNRGFSFTILFGFWE